MLAIYESIEKQLVQQNYSNGTATGFKTFSTEFEELFKKDIQRPVLLSAPSLEEQVRIVSCRSRKI